MGETADNVIKSGDDEFPIPDGATAEETFASIQVVRPELANATLKKVGTHYEVQSNFGRKG
jgi:hypothetical protein